MNDKSGEHRTRVSGVPGLFLPQKELPEVKPLEPLASLPEWAEPSEDVSAPTQASSSIEASDFSSRASVARKKERLWAKRDIIVSVGSLCMILIALWFTSRGPIPVSLSSWHDSHTEIGGGGVLYPNQELVISYPVTERVVHVLVKPGDTVVPNQPLIQLDPSQLNAQTTQAYNDLVAAQSYLQRVTSKANALTIALAQQKYNYAKNKYQSLVAHTSSVTLHRGFLVSPMSGVVTSVAVNPGDLFDANDALVTIMDETKIIAHAKLPLSALRAVKIGQSAQVVLSANFSRHFTGMVIAIIPQADAQTDTFEAWVELPNLDHLLLPGMLAYVQIQNAASKS